MRTIKTNGFGKNGTSGTANDHEREDLVSTLTVAVEADGYVINKLERHAPEEAEALSRLGPDERANLVQRWLGLGFVVDQRVSMISEADYFEKRIQAVLINFNQFIADLKTELDPGVESSLTRPLVDHAVDSKRAITEAQLQLGELMKVNFDQNDKRSAVAKIAALHDGLREQLDVRFDPKRKDSIFGRVDERLEVFAKRLAAPDGPFQAIANQIEALRIELARQDAARSSAGQIIEATTAKGGVFEDEFETQLMTIARTLGDVVDRSTTKVGPGGGKKGDFVIDLARGGGRIAIDTKAGKIRSLPELLKVLEGAAETRGADLAMAVVREADDIPLQARPFQFYEEGIIVDAANFEFAYRVARWIVLVQNKNVPESISGPEARAAVDDIAAAIKHLRPARTHLSAIEKATTAVRGHLSDLESDIVDAVRVLEAGLSAA
jgi:hypothetical protein